MAAKKLSNKPSDDDSFADLFDLDLNDTLKRVVGEPSIDVNESLEETMNRFMDSLPAHREHLWERYQREKEKESNDTS